MLTPQCVSQTCLGGRRTPCAGGTWLPLPFSSVRSSGLQVSQSVLSAPVVLSR